MQRLIDIPEDRILRLGWNQYQVHLDRLVEICRPDPVPDLILAVSRGGMIPAVGLSHALGCPTLGVLSLRRTTSDTPFSLPRNGTTVAGCWIPEGPFRRVLVIDDIIGHGWTFDACGRLLDEHLPGTKRRYLALFDDPHLEKLGPPPSGGEVETAASLGRYRWVVFPWERTE